MRVSQLFTKTLREAPAEAETISHQLLVRTGMIHQIGTGIYSYLPLGLKVLRKLERIIREELDSIGGQELLMPALQPFELWEKTQRHHSFGKGLFTLTDRRDRPLSLGPTHEEVITELVCHQVRSYRDLPLLLYQIQTKFRDEPRPRGGLLRVREFIMMDLYSFHADEESLDYSYQKMLQAYNNVFQRCGLPTMTVEADSGAIGGKESHEFMVIASTGEDEVIYCQGCQYAANVEKALSIKPEGVMEEQLPPEEIATPGMETIEDIAGFFGIPRSRTLKAVFYSADSEVILVTIRGDLEVNEVKLKNALKCTELELAGDEQVRQSGLVAGSASPIGLSGIKIVADDSILLGSNFVAGSNKPGYHIKNINYPRDFKVDLILDIAKTQPGYECYKCHGSLVSTRGIEVGHIFKLGTIFSEKMGALFLDQEGRQKPVIMGCYGLGVGRILAAAIEQNHDDNGIIWPHALAPYHVYLCTLGKEDSVVSTTAEKLLNDLEKEGIEVLFDDRQESPGVKFNDADLLGIPLRVVISPRTIKSRGVEVKQRSMKESHIFPMEGIVSRLKDLLAVA